MLIELIKELSLVGVSFIGLILLCGIFGKTAGYFSPFEDRK